MFVSGSELQKAALRLLAVSKLINQAAGDALSDLLLVEAILRHMGWSIHKWNELYQDLPSRQLKVNFSHSYLMTTYFMKNAFYILSLLSTIIMVYLKSLITVCVIIVYNYHAEFFHTD